MEAVTTAQIAAQRGVSVRTIHRMIKAGTLVPAVKLPAQTGAYLFDPAHVAQVFTDLESKPAVLVPDAA